jgi:hypothetical protein
MVKQRPGDPKQPHVEEVWERRHRSSTCVLASNMRRRGSALAALPNQEFCVSTPGNANRFPRPGK